MNTEEQLMTLEEASNFLRTSKVVVKKLCRDKKLPAVKIGRAWLFDRAVLNEWIRGQK
jgi:excisionase family DNA binding protein